MTFREQGRKRASVPVAEEKLERLDRIAEREAVSRAEKIRELIDKELARHDKSGPKKIRPSDEELAEAYEMLVDVADDRGEAGLRVNLETAKGALYSNDVPKDAVLNRLVKPLKPEWVQIDQKMTSVDIVVRRPPESGSA